MAPDPNEHDRRLRRRERWHTAAALTLLAAIVLATGVIVGWWPR